MKLHIKDIDGHEYTYKNVNFIDVDNGQFVINYQDENDEECEEIGDVPIKFGVEDANKSLEEILG